MEISKTETKASVDMYRLDKIKSIAMSDPLSTLDLLILIMNQRKLLARTLLLGGPIGYQVEGDAFVALEYMEKEIKAALYL
jgi:hypothetical protein